MNRKYLQKFQIKDVVFLAIMSAVALATCAVMPLVISLQPLIFGISQLVTALQIGVFFAIGLYKVRKPGSLLLMALMMGLIQLMMSPPMFLSSVLNGVLIELIVLLLFRGYEKDSAVFCAAMLHTPLSLPFNYLYNRLIKGADSPLAAVADRAPLAAVGMTLAVIAVSALGALIGIKIARELKKSPLPLALPWQKAPAYFSFWAGYGCCWRCSGISAPALRCCPPRRFSAAFSAP